MKFSSESVKLKSKLHNEDFCFNLETPRGHFFAILDFASHDYANLNATLKGKLETIVGSFVSLSRFSAELFLGFLAKEINNFLHNLTEQSGGPELLADGALCLVSGNRLTYFLCGDVHLEVVNNGRLLPLVGPALGTAKATDRIEKLGVHQQEAPVTDVVQSFTLQDNDLVLIRSKGFDDVFANRNLVADIAAVGSTDPRKISEALMKSSASATDDRSLVVLTGPYEKYVDPVLADLSKAVASLESQMGTLSEGQQKPDANQLQILKDDLRGKAARLDLLELDERVKTLSEVVLQKANTSEVLAIQEQILKLGVAGKSERMGERQALATPRNPRSFLGAALLLVLVAAIGGSFLGAWLEARRTPKTQEIWSVKTAGNQIVISRLDGQPATVSVNMAQAVNANGEQRFSSFADVQRYIDTLMKAPAMSPTAVSLESSEAKLPEVTTEVTVKAGDSLRKLAEQYQVPPEKLMALNPKITRWPMIQIGQKIIVPAAAEATSTSPEATQNPSAPTGTMEIVVGPGDSINRLAARYKSSPDKLRELNPNIPNWATIRAGQKVLVPAAQ